MSLLTLTLTLGVHKLAHCCAGELRRASQAPRLFNQLQRTLWPGDWWLVYSVSQNEPDSDGGYQLDPPGQCVPGINTTINRVLTTSQNTSHWCPASRANMTTKVVGSAHRLHKMAICVTLIERHEQQRAMPYSLVAMSRPDLLVCKLQPMRLHASDVPEGTMFVFANGQTMGTTVTANDVLPDHLFVARRATLFSLIRHLRFDVLDWRCVADQERAITQSLVDQCPVHASLGRLGDATLECWLGRRMRLNGWVARYGSIDFTLLRSMPAIAKEGDDVHTWKSNLHRYGSTKCARSGLSFVAEPGCALRGDDAYLRATHKTPI